MQKQKINELLKYTKSKRILRIVFLYNNDDLLDKIIEIYIKLYNSNRSDSEKSDLIMQYIRNRKKEHIEYVICNSQITNNYTYNDQKEIINNYLSSRLSYEQIVNDCYLKVMNNEKVVKKEEITKKKEHKKDKIIDKSAYEIASNKNVLKYRNNKEIYDLIKIYYNDNKGISINIIINENVLKNRNNYEQIELINLYLLHPYEKVYNLIISQNILNKMNLYEQIKLIDIYLDNPNEETYNRIINLISKKDAYKKINNSINKDMKIYKNKLYKKENK